MTPADRVQRVSDDELATWILPQNRGPAWMPSHRMALDLRDARQSEAAKDARITELEAQIATREREAWCAGRDAALAIVDGPTSYSLSKARNAIRALTPPQEGK